ncbi:hypothetical protein ASPBRDRAFT_57152 [Aspergillus brasiliensis CBS 101740]|uniref:Uncharacterized protein n=1 Tax=Aspergillus brasiliensis (strain CBS 101740 / IMI 381727 / IBT 21946) TaxID=767769 RepID=A0A1L9UCU2_ASPBC|nr:hypothetical protein ASPBRDRAFT_57152 [Aspergillus brasiliensis CBS 101740]
MASAYLDRHISYWQQNMPRTTRCCTFGAIGKAVSKQASKQASDPAPARPPVLTHQGLSEPVTQMRGSASGVDACHGMPRPYHQNDAGSSLLPDLRTEMQDDPDVAAGIRFVLRFQTHRRREFRNRVGRPGDDGTGRHAAPQRGVPLPRSLIAKISVGPYGSRTAHSNAALPRLSPVN